MKNYLVYTALLFTIFSCSNMKKNYSDKMEYKIDSLLSQMTLDEKFDMLHASSSFTSGGVERLGIPELVMSDGPHGVRVEHGRDWEIDTNANDEATYLPVGICLASTWNRHLGYQFGSVLANEAKERGKHIILGPGVNIIRTPLNGRNFEYLSEDPYLSAEMGIGYINGVQENGIAACVKHYIANNQETWRHKVNVTVSDQALHEIYLPAFKAAVQEADVYTLMGAYNKVWGQFCCHNEKLNNQLLRNDLGFDGVIISDWGGVHNSKEALLYSTDIEMGTDLDQRPNIDYNKFYLADSAKTLVKSGEVPEEVVDEKVRNILRLHFRLNTFNWQKGGERNTKAHQQLALKVAEEGIVLLKNENILPLKKDEIKSIAVIGDNATRKHAMGGGSSQVKPPYEVTPLEGLKNLVGNDIEILHAQGYTANYDYAKNPQLINEAVKAAKNADVAIVFGGWLHSLDGALWGEHSFDAEGRDKEDLQMLFGQNELIKKVIAANPNTIVVLYGGGPLDMSAWQSGAKGIIQAWYPGMEGGNALAKIIFGQVNPSGKLTMTFSNNLSDYSSHSIGEFPGKDLEVNYNEGIFVGYRHFDRKNIEPAYCFGHGLSYTTFEYSDLTIERDDIFFKVSFNITNTGKKAGSEIAQLYLRDMESSVQRPKKELKGFEKVFLQPDETKQVALELPLEAFNYYSETEQKWVHEPGEFYVMVGSSLMDIRLTGKISYTY